MPGVHQRLQPTARAGKLAHVLAADLRRLELEQMERLTNKTFEKWRSWTDKIEADLQNIINYHQIYEHFIEMVNENLLHVQKNHGTLFCSFVRKCYGVHAAAGIRRHVKNEKDSISLMKLLYQLEKSANQFTYEFYLKQFPLEKGEWEWQKPSSIYARIFSLRKLGKVRAFYGFLHSVSFSGGYDEHLLANDYETCLGNIMRCRISDRLCRRWWTGA